jgi:hypothetical protein
MGPLDLIRAPAQLAASVATGALGIAIDVVKAARGLVEGGSPEPPPAPSGRAEATANGTPTRPVSRPPAEPPPPPSPRPEPPIEEEHVDEGVVLVAETAEAGAEDGAGPELEVEQPWDGYDRMTAEEIAAELAQASSEAVAAVQLYEAVTRSRNSVLEAAERRLRELTPPGSQTS